MVRFKKRYFVVQLDREKDIYDPFSKHHQASLKPRAIQDSRPLDIPDGVLAATIKDLVQQVHGDFGRASITTGLRTIYCNSETHLVLIQCRHGPHRLVASSLPFLTKIKDEKIVPKLIYTGATIKNCYKVCIQIPSTLHSQDKISFLKKYSWLFFREWRNIKEDSSELH